MQTDEIPPLPTREQELEYMSFLEKSISKDPWFSIRAKKYMANPWRLYYKKKIEQRKEYYKTFFKNSILSFVISSPLIIYLANRYRYEPSGVPTTRVLSSSTFNPHIKIAN